MVYVVSPSRNQDEVPAPRAASPRVIMLHANLLMSNIAPPIVDGRDISRQFGAWSPRQQETGHGPNFRPQSFRGGSLRRSRAPALKRLKDVGVVLPAALELTVRLDELHAERLKLAELRGPVRALVELDRDVVPCLLPTLSPPPCY